MSKFTQDDIKSQITSMILQLAWCLNLDLTCLDYDGNVAEACVLAATAALAGLTLPRVTTEEGKINVLLDRDRAEVTTGPLAATFAVLADDVIVVDPTHEEECLAEETFTVVLAANGNICGVHKPGTYILQNSRPKGRLGGIIRSN